MLPLVTLTIALFANFKMYHCSVMKPFEMDFLLDGTVVGQFDSRLQNGRIGPKISMRADVFVKQFNLPEDRQEFYCYTSQYKIQSFYTPQAKLNNIFEWKK